LKPVEINFSEYDRTMKHGKGGRALLLKATGLNKHKGLNILDATAGLMRDAFFMAKFGGVVTAVERSPVLIDMIETALTHLTDSAPRLAFLGGNALEIIPKLSRFDVIYLDPMFREEKSAKAKKDLQFLQQLLQEEPDDTEQLFLVALAHAPRVVVKRSRYAPFLGEKNPTFQYHGESTRFDVYLTNSNTTLEEAAVSGQS